MIVWLLRLMMAPIILALTLVSLLLMSVLSLAFLPIGLTNWFSFSSGDRGFMDWKEYVIPFLYLTFYGEDQDRTALEAMEKLLWFLLAAIGGLVLVPVQVTLLLMGLPFFFFFYITRVLDLAIFFFPLRILGVLIGMFVLEIPEDDDGWFPRHDRSF